MDPTKTAYAAWLEGMIGAVMKNQPSKIAVCGLLPNGQWFTGYFGQQDSTALAVMAHHIYEDSILKVVTANAGQIKDAIEEQEGN